MVRNIAISGYAGTGTTTLGRGIAKKLGWRFIEGGEIFAGIHKDLGISEEKVPDRPDKYDFEVDKQMQKMFAEGEQQVIEAHLAGYNARGIDGVFKIRLVCQENGKDRPEVRFARIAKRDGIPQARAHKREAIREQGNTEKYRRIYHVNPYEDDSLYNLTINTFDKNEGGVLQVALESLALRA